IGRARNLVVGLAILAILGAGAATAFGDDPATGTPPSGPGLVGGMGFSEGSSILGDSDADLVRRLDGMVAAGAQWLRPDFDWSGPQPSPTTFDWGATDRIVSRAVARGLKVDAILAYTPSWARPAGTDTHYPPTDPATFAAFARAAVQHYGDDVGAWEIWNE